MGLSGWDPGLCMDVATGVYAILIFLFSHHIIFLQYLICHYCKPGKDRLQGSVLCNAELIKEKKQVIDGHLSPSLLQEGYTIWVVCSEQNTNDEPGKTRLKGEVENF